MEFFSEPWAPLLVFGAIASGIWVVLWTILKVRGNFDRVVLGGVPALAGGLVLTSLFGGVVLLVGAVLTGTLSIIWLVAAATGAFSREREAIENLLRVEPGKGNAGSED